MGRLAKLWLRLHHGQEGLTLIETLVALAMFAVIGVALMNGLSTGYKSVGISQERTYAGSLAESQVEYIKAQKYIAYQYYDPDVPGNHYNVIDIPAYLSNYSVEINPPELISEILYSGYELQAITVKVKHHGATKLTITFYRAGLSL